MSVRYRGAGVGVILALVGGAVLLALGLWGATHLVRSDLQGDTAPIRRLDTSPGPR
jgi:hypothetical protein